MNPEKLGERGYMMASMSRLRIAVMKAVEPPGAVMLGSTPFANSTSNVAMSPRSTQVTMRNLTKMSQRQAEGEERKIEANFEI